MKVNEMTMNQGSRGDKSIIWTVSDTYVNWCQIVVGNPEYLEKLYTGTKKTSCFQQMNMNQLTSSVDAFKSSKNTSNRNKSCPCTTNQATGPTDLVSTKGPCSMEEYNQWKRLIELVELKQKCAELQRRLQNETFYKCRMAMTKDCKKQVFECPCVPRNTDAYVQDPNKLGGGNKNGNGKDGKNKDGKKGKGGGNGGKGKKDNQGGASKGQKGNGKGGKGKNKGGFTLLDTAGQDSCIEFQLSTDERKVTNENVPKKIFTFHTDPFCFEGNYFKQRDCGEKYLYPDGNVAALFECDGTGTIFYPNGEVAITVSKGKLGCRLQIMSKSGHDDKGQYFKTAPIGLFDSKGNGVIYDHYGKIRLNYDQAEGILYDTSSGAPSRWQWQKCSFVKMRREQLQGVKEDDPDDEGDEIEEEVQPKVEIKKRASKGKNKSRETGSLTKNKTHISPAARTLSNSQSHAKTSLLSNISQGNHKKDKDNMEDWASIIEQACEKVAIEPKPIVMKLNKYISLRILKQEHIHLDFRPFPLHFHLNLGVKVKPEQIERIDRVTMGQGQASAVPCYFELLHTRTRSLRNLHTNLETIRKDNITEDKINFIKKAKLMGILKYITQMAMKKLNQDEQRLTKMIYKCQ